MKKKIKAFIKKMGFYRIRNNAIFTLNRNYKIYQSLKKKYKSLLANEYSYTKEAYSKKVWFCWLQGLDNAPDLVKSCYDYINKNLNDYEIIVITESNFRQYTDIPDYIVEKWKSKIITNTHFSDILRVELLAKNGGIWIDSTVLCTSKLPNYLNESDFFVFSAEYRNDESSLLSSWFILSNKNHPIILQTRDLLHDYWKKNNKLVHYFLFHMFMSMAIEKYSNLMKNVPFVSNINPHVLQFKYLFDKYDLRVSQFIKDTCFVHKLSYKFEKELTEIEGTNYKAILERKF